MAIESPLFQSSMELLGHSITHFNGTDELDRKLLILHLANSVELILKDILLDLGESIYKNPKETVTIHGCLETLKAKEFAIPYKNKIELLIDERNALQHRFGSPNELTAIFYMTIAADFFKELLGKHYKQDYEETISQFTPEKDLAAFRMRKPRNESELENLKRLSKVHPLGALLSGVAYLESKMDTLIRDAGIDRGKIVRHPWMLSPVYFFSRIGIEMPEDLAREMEDMRRLRNLAAHGRIDPTQEGVIRSIATVERFEQFIDSIDKIKIKQSVQEFMEERKKNDRKPITR